MSFVWPSSITEVLTSGLLVKIRNLKAWYNFNNPASLGHDYSGNVNTATISGAVYTASGISSGGMSFTGASDYLDFLV